MAGLFGLSRSNHDLDTPQAWGKNIFTNTLPVALAQYLDQSLGLRPVVIKAYRRSQGTIGTRHDHMRWAQIIGTSPRTAGFLFEHPFDGFKPYTNERPNKSDVVVIDQNDAHTAALEIKLTVVPDSATRFRPYHEQSSEMVFRPPTIEQLAYSICAAYGLPGRMKLNELILDNIPQPQQWQWGSEQYVKRRIPAIENVIKDVISNDEESQSPLILNVVWRTDGVQPVLLADCFDVFVWTNFGLLAMFLNSSLQTGVGRALTRPQRTLVWLVKLLYDYSVQRRVDSRDTFGRITFGAQSDKAGSFSGSATLPYLRGPELERPRIPAEALKTVVFGGGADYLAPERRLDAAIFIQLVRDGMIN